MVSWPTSNTPAPEADSVEVSPVRRFRDLVRAAPPRARPPVPVYRPEQARRKAAARRPEECARDQQQFLDWHQGLKGPPGFAFLNYYDVHDPYVPPLEYERRFLAEVSAVYDIGDVDPTDTEPSRRRAHCTMLLC